MARTVADSRRERKNMSSKGKAKKVSEGAAASVMATHTRGREGSSMRLTEERLTQLLEEAAAKAVKAASGGGRADRSPPPERVRSLGAAQNGRARNFMSRYGVSFRCSFHDCLFMIAFVDTLDDSPWFLFLAVFPGPGPARGSDGTSGAEQGRGC